MDAATLNSLLAVIRDHAPAEDIFIFGSASLLIWFPELGLDDNSLVRKSRDADFLLDPYDQALASEIKNVVARERSFHREHGFYADIARPAIVENFSPGWRERVKPMDGQRGVYALEPHDLAAAKAVAGRLKDRKILHTLIATKRIGLETVAERVRAW